MEQLKVFLRSIVKNVGFGIQTCFRASKKYFFLKCLVLCSTTFMPLMSIWLWKEILNGIVTIQTAKNTVIACLVGYFLIQMMTYLLSRLDVYLNERYMDELTFYMESVMIEKISGIDIAFFDSASMGDKVRHARRHFWTMNEMTWLVFDILSELINIVAVFFIVSRYKPWIGILTLLLLIPFMLYNKKYTEACLERTKNQLRDQRKMDYCSELFFDNNVQFEIKLNGIHEYFIHLQDSLWRKLYRINKGAEVKYQIGNGLILMLNVSSECIVLLVSVIDVIGGKIGLGDLQYNLSMVTRLREQASVLMRDINTFIVNNKSLVELQEFMNIVPEIEKSGARVPSANPRIAFCNVSFHYPNAKEDVLKDCSFVIEPHEKIGLIGLNGAGKSTIIKLLFRFYDPQQGSITLDDVDIREYDVNLVRQIFGVLFQDYVSYCLPLREIIALSDFEARFDDEKLKKACDISGVSAIIKDWEAGYDSVLGRYYADNGKDLSGGQWQLVGLARAYFKESNYMILDEPSASLDPISEDRIFKQLYELSKGKSSITISHRLSNTILADRILVIGDGHIIEQGSHFELIKQKGRYAHLFGLQASQYS